MNPFGGTENLLIDGVSVKLPVQNDSVDALSTNISFQKPCWMPDIEANFCLNCNLKFTHLRRKHHCRNCGKIFCSKCCSEKMSLPHFGMDEPEKVCNNCKLIVELMLKSKSDDVLLKLESISGLSNLTKNVAGLCKVIECGGIHAMISMALDDDLTLKGAVASALHNIAQNMSLNAFLVDAGCLRVLKNFLSSSHGCCELLSDSLSALNLLCMDANIRIQALKEGIVDPLLTVISYTGTTAVFAARILQLLVSNFDCHEFVLQNHRQIVSSLFQALRNEDYQMQTCLSKMLVYFSAGSDSFRQLIIQEDVTNGFPLLYLLKGASQNVLVNVACIVANISLSVDQYVAQQYITGICELLSVINEESCEVLVHLGRGLANFAECPSNSLQLIHNLRNIISTLLKSNFEVPRFHACRLIIYLISSEPSCTLDALSQSGMDEFIETVFGLPGITDILNNMLLRKVSRFSVCQ